MSLPVRLGVGLVSIYGTGSTQAIFDPNRNGTIVFGTINAMNSQYSSVSVGQSVMYNMKDVIAPSFYIDTPYYILPEDKIISVEDNITPP